MKVGLIARANNRGLGIESWELFKNIKPFKTLVVVIGGETIFPERFPNARFCCGIPSDKDIDWLMDGIDCVFSFETWYREDIVNKARASGIKAVLRINYEWWSEEADVYIVPSLWNYSAIPEPKVYIPSPINRKLLRFKLRERAKTFLFNAGNLLAGYDRNGLEIINKTIPLVKSDVRFIIKSQTEIEKKINDKRVKYIIEDIKNYWEQWDIDADVLLFPRRYGGLSLILNEAMSCGLAVISGNVSPQNEFLPPDLLIKPVRKRIEIIKKPVIVWDFNPKDFASKIDEIANNNISKYSKISNEIAKNWSWKNLKNKYLEAFKKI